MKASSKKSTVPQGLDSSASEQAVVFAFSVLAAAGVRLRHHQFLAYAAAHPVVASRTAIVRDARALLWQCMRAMRDADKAWGL
jgi:hypothetical protein